MSVNIVIHSFLEISVKYIKTTMALFVKMAWGFTMEAIFSKKPIFYLDK